MDQSAKLQVGDQSVELPITRGTEAERTLDVTKLRQQTGLTTYDPGYVNTASCSSVDHISRRRSGHSSIQRDSDRGLSGTVEFSRNRLPLNLWNVTISI